MPALVTDSPRKKRRWTPFWRLPALPLCPKCGAICIVNGTESTESGHAVQYRRCPRKDCGGTVKTTYRQS